MARIWKVIAVDPEVAQEEGTGTWEPFAVAVHDSSGSEVILCKGLVDTEIEDVDGKASEVTGGLGIEW